MTGTGSIWPFLAETAPPADASSARLGQAGTVERYGPSSYGEAFADVYDEWYGTLGDEPAAVDLLSELAAGEPVLELGVGTGRLAIPLAERGLQVWGLDASAAMLSRLAAKPGGERIHGVEADMADFQLSRPRFGLVFAAYNTLFNVTSQSDQARCLARVAEHLRPGGRLVVEAFVPIDDGIPEGRVVEVKRIESDRVLLTVSHTDPRAQVVAGDHVEITAGRRRRRSWRIRFLTPTQLDEMATGAGLTLLDRWGGWRREPFDDASATHVSVYVTSRPR